MVVVCPRDADNCDNNNCDNNCDNEQSDSDNRDATDRDCFICAKAVSASDAPLTPRMLALPCTCLYHCDVHAACFEAWYTREGTCPCCRSAGPARAERLARRAARLAEHHARNEHIAQRLQETHARMCMAFACALATFAMLGLAALLLLHGRGSDADDDRADDDMAGATYGPAWWSERA